MLKESALHHFFNNKSTSCGRGPSSELTPTASAASLGHVRLQAVARDSRFARYCEEVSLDGVFIRLKLVDSLAISGNNGNYYDSSETSSIAFRMRAAAPP